MGFISKHWGDLASLLGLGLTIWAALRAKTAAEQARDAAQEIQTRMSTLDTLGDLTSAISALHEIMRLQRSDLGETVAWNIVLDRYANLQLQLIRSAEGCGLTEDHQSTIQTALLQFRIIVGEIEQARTDEERSRLDTSTA